MNGKKALTYTVFSHKNKMNAGISCALFYAFCFFFGFSL